jgi:hypothetical protein
MHQWGIAMPGGAEALVHWRDTVEQAARQGTIPAVVIADIDMKNFFNTVEWEAIRSSIQEHLPEASPSVCWEQEEPGTTILANGDEFRFNRGAEQGESLGSTKAALPLGDAIARISDQWEGTPPVCDNWFIDDGALVCAPHAFDTWLQAFDCEIAKIGVSRGSGSDVKSSAKLVCTPEAAVDHIGWDTDYVRNTCKVLGLSSASEYLGTATRVSAADSTYSVEAALGKISKKREAIARLQNPAAEQVLTRRCADVSCLTY